MASCLCQSGIWCCVPTRAGSFCWWYYFVQVVITPIQIPSKTLPVLHLAIIGPMNAPINKKRLKYWFFFDDAFIVLIPCLHWRSYNPELSRTSFWIELHFVVFRRPKSQRFVWCWNKDGWIGWPQRSEFTVGSRITPAGFHARIRIQSQVYPCILRPLAKKLNS